MVMMTAERLESFRIGLLNWSEENLRSFSWRETTEPYEVLIAEILLQKTAAEKVEPTYVELLETYPTPEDLANADEEQLADIIYSLGFQNQRSKALIAIGENIRNTGVPGEAKDLLELPHVGPYAANATLCFAFGESCPIVDANVVRVYNRIFQEEFDYRDGDVWSFAADVLPDDEAQQFNLAILDFASLICQPKVPNCEECFFSDECSYFQPTPT